MHMRFVSAITKTSVAKPRELSPPSTGLEWNPIGKKEGKAPSSSSEVTDGFAGHGAFYASFNNTKQHRKEELLT